MRKPKEKKVIIKKLVLTFFEEDYDILEHIENNKAGLDFLKTVRGLLKEAILFRKKGYGIIDGKIYKVHDEEI